jgi:hypothetical protein
MAYGTVNADIIQSSVSGVSLGAGNASIMKNRIINGAMVIDQRNAGVSGTSANTFTVDRWAYYGSQASKGTWGQNLNSVTPPVGFNYYLGFQSSSAYSVVAADQFELYQRIEGFNTADLGWGTANAKTVTLSFQVYSSLTGTFGGVLGNSAQSYSYPFTYSIPVANTWTQISVTIAGPTAGTWVGATNGIGIAVYFGLGVGSTFSGTAGSWSANNYLSATGATSVVGTNGATFYITGVQLEVGSSATGFEYRQYQQELALCQRYYMRWSNAIASNIGLATGVATGGNTPAVRRLTWSAPVPFRTQPTLSYAGSANLYTVGLTNLGVTAISFNSSGYNQISIDVNTTSSGTIGQGLMFILDGNNASTYFDASAEL